MTRLLYISESGCAREQIAFLDRCVRLSRHDEIHVALSDLSRGHGTLQYHAVKLLAAPLLQKTNVTASEESLCYADLLHDTGFADETALRGAGKAWQALYDLIDADAVVFYNSPAALLASGNHSFKKIVCGHGFLCPPPARPLGVFFPDLMREEDLNRIDRAEQRLLNRINRVAGQLTLPGLSNLGELYSRADTCLLTTFPEFDHFPDRENANYTGLAPPSPGTAPEWPNVSGKRIYVDIDSHPRLTWFLDCLIRSGQSVIINGRYIEQEKPQTDRAANLHFELEDPDVRQLADQCDFAVVSGNHDVSSRLLLAGVPLIVLPSSREQQMFSRRVHKMGLGLAVHPDDQKQTVAALNRIATDERYRHNAMKMAMGLQPGNDFAERLGEALNI